MRKSTAYLVYAFLSSALFALLLVATPVLKADECRSRLDQARHLVEELGLTDLCLFTEARYTRHPSQTDLYSAFQDHPMSMEHFPSGSIVFPPATIQTSCSTGVGND